MAQKRVLIVTTSHDRMGSTGYPTGVWLEELAVPYYALQEGGAEVVLASVKGGEVPFDPRSLPGQGQEVVEAVHRFLGDERAMAAARSTPAMAAIDASGFDAVFLPGGHGTMWDLPESEPLARLVGRFFDEGRIVAAVCHGPAGLVSARRRDGRPIVEGRRVNGFTNSEEEGAGLTRVVPFLLEDRLKEQGGRFERGPDWQPFAVRDGNLITGQNPQSSALVAQHVLTAVASGPLPGGG
jgi:putative intracellular protease/amidase